ncbi:hypothetical protein B0U03_02285 [Listeria monocytogenes]|nr:hypothetical protein [Listeria monocytogenes]EAE9689109.1 hypothetical protein [Listeria monocytogenes]EAE9692170.1 hypothetical protein [Listeria monocytogenes]EAE9694120.1 hypothetical protein [Listeria monocytogenes]EAE9697669.1 hypothetical protein [Listeria monocytogenes]
MTIYKRDLYEIITEAKKVRSKQLREKHDREAKAHIEQIIKDNNLEDELKEFIACRNKSIELAEKLHEALPGNYGSLSQTATRTITPSYEYLIDELSQIRFSRDESLRQFRYNQDSETNSVYQEYQKLEGQIKALSGKQGYELLKNLGFDVSSIDVEAKQNQNQIAIVPLDKNLLGVDVSENE